MIFKRTGNQTNFLNQTTNMKILLAFIIVLTSYFTNAQTTDSTWFKNNYTKKEVSIPMRDGVKLFTSIYIPKSTSEKHPILMTRTPYSCQPYGDENYNSIYWSSFLKKYVKEEYILVIQDVRGRWMSEGEFKDVRPFNANKKGNEIDESSDTYDTINWLLKNIPNNNGNVGMFGISYGGFYSTMAAASC